MVDEIPFNEIKETCDRSWSLRLVERLSSGVSDDHDNVVEALIQLGDPRTEQPLLALVLNSQKNAAVRKAASDILSKINTYETDEERALWWASNDPVIVRHALLVSEAADANRVTEIAGNHLHPLYHEAIRTLEFWEAVAFQRLIINALDHQDPRVRETGAKCLLWEQPVVAEKRLLELAEDADEKVAVAALDTLVYCSSREIILRLDELRRQGREGLRDNYENAFDYVQKEFYSWLPGSKTESKEKTYLLKWLQPIKHLLPKKRQEKSSKIFKANRKEPALPKPEVTARSIIEDLSEVDGKWCHKEYRYYSVDWTKFSASDRLLLQHFFERHADATVRVLGAMASAAWRDTDAILRGLHDCDFRVLKTSAYYSRKLIPSQLIAERLRELIGNPNVMGTFAHEVLESYVQQSNTNETYDWLVELAQNDSRPSIRLTAARELNVIENKSRMKELISILDEPPINTWSVHCAVLSGCKQAWVGKSTLDHLMAIDNLELQRKLASWICGD